VPIYGRRRKNISGIVTAASVVLRVALDCFDPTGEYDVHSRS
jgi:hypothetical protein